MRAYCAEATSAAAFFTRVRCETKKKSGKLENGWVAAAINRTYLLQQNATRIADSPQQAGSFDVRSRDGYVGGVGRENRRDQNRVWGRFSHELVAHFVVVVPAEPPELGVGGRPRIGSEGSG